MVILITIGEIRDDLRDALDELGISDKAAAIDMEMDAGQWSRMKRGTGRERLALEPLTRLPDVFWDRWLTKLSARVQRADSEAAEAVAELFHAIARAVPALSRKPMARMALAERNNERGVA